MVLQGSGRITLKDVAGEFGGSTPHNLSEYYAAATGVPGTGPIRLSNFYGKSNNPLPPTWISGADVGYYYTGRYQAQVTATSDSAVTYSVISKSPELQVYSLSASGVLDFFLNKIPPAVLQAVIRATDQEDQSVDKTFYFYLGTRAYYNEAYKIYTGDTFSGTSNQIPFVYLGTFPAGSFVYIDLRTFITQSQYDSLTFNISSPKVLINNLIYTGNGIIQGTLTSTVLNGWGFGVAREEISSRFDNASNDYAVQPYDGYQTAYFRFDTY